MQEIDKIRSEIDQIHGDLATLFQRRLTLTKKIWEIKKNNQLSFFDQKRENDIIHRFDSSISDADERMAVQNFFKSILSESKKYLEVKLK
ncbi:MAG: chorismate mutase [Bdellovibrionaceae bacterium]|nr:chorismate mutase [Pseudobdellovibrionaceae bacterium]